MHEGRQPTRPAPRPRRIRATLEQKARELRVALVHGFVESCVREIRMLFEQTKRPDRITLMSTLTHRDFKLTAGIRRRFLTWRNVSQRLRCGVLEQPHDF